MAPDGHRKRGVHRAENHRAPSNQHWVGPALEKCGQRLVGGGNTELQDHDPVQRRVGCKKDDSPEQQLHALDLRHGQVMRRTRQVSAQESRALADRRGRRHPKGMNDAHLNKIRAAVAGALIDNRVRQEPVSTNAHQ